MTGLDPLHVRLSEEDKFDEEVAMNVKDELRKEAHANPNHLDIYTRTVLIIIGSNCKNRVHPQLAMKNYIFVILLSCCCFIAVGFL